MKEPRKEIYHVLLGRPHHKTKGYDYSCELIIQKVKRKFEACVYVYFSFVENGEYVRKNASIGNHDMEWDNILKILPDTLNVLIGEKYQIWKDFKHRIDELKECDKHKLRFEKNFIAFDMTPM